MIEHDDNDDYVDNDDEDDNDGDDDEYDDVHSITCIYIISLRSMESVKKYFKNWRFSVTDASDQFAKCHRWHFATQEGNCIIDGSKCHQIIIFYNV